MIQYQTPFVFAGPIVSLTDQEIIGTDVNHKLVTEELHIVYCEEPYTW